MKELVYVVEDEPDIAELLLIHLEKAGFRTRHFKTAKSFFKEMENALPDLVLLDLMLEDSDGLEICKVIKGSDKTRSIGVIMLTARAEEIDKVLGLELGADDYVTKPFSPKELVARIRAVLRRNPKTDQGNEPFIKFGDIVIYPEKFLVQVKGKNIELTSTEFKILEALAKRPGWVFSREKLLDYIWGYEKAVVDRTVDVHIRHLREKLGDAGEAIKNIRGVGYKMEE